MDNVGYVWNDLTYAGQVMVVIVVLAMAYIFYLVLAEIVAMVRDSKSFRWTMQRIFGPPMYRQELRNMPSVAAPITTQRIRMVRRN